ncbi:MAG TPA: NAD(P)-dependent oxidoreductase [Dehalococcoidia bacterium]|nr:NAD(P)-dependent oxidoreductase [Dehalococcoidia bacterium]
MNVGFIGIGQMGKHMSRHILSAGYSLVVHDLIKESANALLDKGAKWGKNPGEIAETCQVVISSLPTPQDVEQVVYGENGLKSGWKDGDIYIDMSTNSPLTIRRIADDARKMGVAVLDAPVSGGTRGAELGSLTIMVGGDSSTLEKVRSILETMGQKIFHLGNVGCGNIAKLVNNMIALTCSSITAEGFVLGVKAGINPQVLWDIITISTGNNWALQQYQQGVLRGDFSPAYRLSLGRKDARLALELGKDYDVPLPLGAVMEQKLIEAEAAGLGDQHVDAVILRLEELTGIKVRA